MFVQSDTSQRNSLSLGCVSSYRFGFNGKENDDEVYGSTGTFQDYGFRMYDTRMARFISVDPLTKKYPYYTPYQFASNKPIMAIDVDGLEDYIKIFNTDATGRETLIKTIDYTITEQGTGPLKVHGELFLVKKGDTFDASFSTQFGTSYSLNGISTAKYWVDIVQPENPNVVAAKQAETPSFIDISTKIKVGAFEDYKVRFFGYGVQESYGAYANLMESTLTEQGSTTHNWFGGVQSEISLSSGKFGGSLTSNIYGNTSLTLKSPLLTSSASYNQKEGLNSYSSFPVMEVSAGFIVGGELNISLNIDQKMKTMFRETISATKNFVQSLDEGGSADPCP